MVTHSSTNRPVQCLCMAERTGCPVLTDLWSYVLIRNCTKIIRFEFPNSTVRLKFEERFLGLSTYRVFLHLDSHAFNQFRRFTEENSPYVKVDT
jgi:hypothetical protein